jgi:hypothetical protein
MKRVRSRARAENIQSQKQNESGVDQPRALRIHSRSGYQGGLGCWVKEKSGCTALFFCLT